MPALEVAARHAAARSRLAARLRSEARAAWHRVDPARISATWTIQIRALLAALIAGQRAAAATADTYLAAQGIQGDAKVNPAAFAGIASDGRNLGSLLALPAIVALEAIGQGRPVPQAMAVGGALAELAAHTQITDAGRVADQVGLVARGGQGYVRMAVGPTCSRCLILAGRWYRWNAGFARHEHCDCIGIPAAENVSDDLITDPMKAFKALSEAEQNRVFTKAGAQAIRDGANMAKVVNARRGMYTAGGKVFTREAARKRPRIMPEQIYLDAKDREDAIRLLRLHGYIL